MATLRLRSGRPLGIVRGERYNDAAERMTNLSGPGEGLALDAEVEVE
jgi:hypothetical protein